MNLKRLTSLIALKLFIASSATRRKLYKKVDLSIVVLQKMILIYTTCKNVDEAKKIGKLIIEQRLAACVNVWPIGSIYFWNDTLTEDNEAVLLVKTIETKIYEIEELLMKNHSYATPFIGSIDVRRINREYKEWMSTVIR